MRRLLLIVLIFLMIGAVSAHDDANDTADPILKDEEYNLDIDDEMLVVEEDDYIPVEINVDEAWSLNVYINGHNSTINDEFNDVAYDQIDIPTTVMIDDEVPLGLGKHNIIYEFKFTNTTSVYDPEVYIIDSGLYFDFNLIGTSEDPQNSIYRFNSKFNIIKSVEPISTTIDLGDIDITYSDSLLLNIKGLNSGKVIIYLNDRLFNSFDIDENPCLNEIDTTKLAIGSYNLVCVVESDQVYAKYDVKADNSDSMINVKFVKSKKVYSPNKYITIVNTTLNILDFPELNTIYLNTPPINITYTRGIPVLFEGDEACDVAVYIDGVKVYDNSVLFSWQNICYIPTKDADGNYFNEGIHNISFEFVFLDKYLKFNPEISWHDDTLILDFFDFDDSSVILNDKYVANTKLNIINKNTEIIPIYSQDIVSIVHTDDINLEIEGLPYCYNLTVFVDDVEIYDSYTDNSTINIKTFFARSSIEETNERDILTGNHSIRFDFKTLYTYDVDISFRNNALHFKFNQIDSNIKPNGVYYRFNTSLIVNEKEKTVHILNKKSHTYFEDTEFVVKLDLYEPDDWDEDWDEDSDDWDDDWDDLENPIGIQDVGIIVSNDDGIVYIGDYLINVYEDLDWNYEFENENLPRAGIYTIKIINLADNTYDTASFEVKKANRIFNKKYSSDDFNVLFTLDFPSCREDLNSLCHINLNNEEKVINVKKGLAKSKTEVLFKDIDPGVYTATFTLEGNEIYNDVTLKSKVTVKKEAPTITCLESDGNKIYLAIDISQSKSDAILSASAGGEQKKFTINKNTKYLTVEFNNLSPGNYNVEIDFEGNERYASKTLTVPLEITSYRYYYSPPPTTEPVNDINQSNGLGNNTGGIGTGSGNSNVSGSGNGTFNGKISFNGKGFSGDFCSQGSGHGDGAKSYEVTKSIINFDNNVNNAFLILLIISLVILVLGFIYERQDNDDSKEY
ncbi:hypothetical protein [Methanobrevibacter sp.]|uniref:hypothetical protein n=1 Tax=Methanobrevibacter sp. TaxID=66852 RepID=UPI003870BE92